MNLGMNLRKLRKAKGLTQTDVAEKLGVTQSAYAHYENGVRKLEADKVPLVAKAIGVSVAEIYGVEVGGMAPEARPHKNKRSMKVQELFDQLPPTEQRIVLKQIKLMAGK